MTTLEQLLHVRDSLRELVPDPDIDFGPAYGGAVQRKCESLKIVNGWIRLAQKESLQPELGYSRVGLNNV
jgi:hypothetical protein